MDRTTARVAGLLLLYSLPLRAQSLPDLFQDAKSQVRSEKWAEALATLDRLELEAAKPGNEAAKTRLAGPIAFYRGVCEANLDQAEKSEADFAEFLQEQPGATIDEAIYSKKVVTAFHAASKSAAMAASNKDASPDRSASLLHKFETFQSPPNMGEKPDDRWADGPVKWILTAEDRAAWVGLAGGAERAEFVEKFWEKRNPKPGSGDNASRTSFDRRVAFADTYFRVDEQKRGSLTDPGMVFILLGPPSWTGRKPILGNEERSISDGASLDEQWWMGARNSIHIDGQRATNADGYREIWRYRQGASGQPVSVVFVTKKGYGQFVLQREPATLSALDAARSGGSGH